MLAGLKLGLQFLFSKMFDHFIHVWESPEDVIATSVACVK